MKDCKNSNEHLRIHNMNHMGDTLSLFERESNTIWKAKAIAIIFTICAHCNTIPENSSFLAKAASCFLASLGSLGVPVFLFFSGYLFSYKSITKCAKTKIRTLIVPWITCGSLVYLYVYLRKGQMSFLSYFKWLLGIDTYLWYLSVSVVLILIGECVCWISNRTKISAQCIGLICISLSVIILLMESVELLALHPYLNIFRWQWIFAFGMIARQKYLIKYLPATYIPFVLGIIVLLLLALTGYAFSYWSRYWAAAAVVVVISVIMMCKYCKDSSILLMDIGKKSFTIYLLHMPVAGITVNILNRVYDTIGIMTLLRPVVVLTVTYIFLKIIEVAIRKCKIGPIVRCVLGIR